MISENETQSLILQMANKDNISSLWQAPVGWVTEQTLKILEQIPAILCDNYSRFEKQPLACYRALVDTELLTIGPQVTKWPELPIMNWVLSHLPSYKVVQAQWHSIINETVSMSLGLRGPWKQKLSYEEVAQMPMVPTPAILSSLFLLLSL